MNLMNTCIRAVLIPLASANVTIRRDMEKNANLALDRIEEKVNNIMQRSIDVVITWVTKLLARQNKSDFRPRDDALGGGGGWLEQLQTPVRVTLSMFYSPANTINRPANQSSNSYAASITWPLQRSHTRQTSSPSSPNSPPHSAPYSSSTSRSSL